MDPIRLSTLPLALRDRRAGKVVFLSHCLLNQNVRYLGGAFRPAAVDELVEVFRRDGIGICQLRCPEEVAWGGVIKRAIWWMAGSRGKLRALFRRPLLALFGWYTRVFYRHLAAAAGRQIRDYLRSGFDVVGVVGIADSPSCGVQRTLDLRAALDVLIDVPLSALTARVMNDSVVAAHRVPGPGWFMRALARWLERRGITVPLVEIDLSSASAAVDVHDRPA